VCLSSLLRQTVGGAGRGGVGRGGAGRGAAGHLQVTGGGRVRPWAGPGRAGPRSP
ncbi:Forkhead box protein D3-A, partial [Frankliniella fusca]